MHQNRPARSLNVSFQPAAGKLYAILFNLLLSGGVAALGYYFSWWLVDDRLRSPLLVLVLIPAICYAVVQLFGNWYLYSLARRPAFPPMRLPGITVDVFVTAYKEPYGMIERSLTAACNLRGEHRTWLLDDGSDPILEALARRLGAGYLTRHERSNAKAGNLNAALSRTDGDIIAIFDVDHVPRPDFLERSLGYFSDPQVGFVQVMLTFNNRQESWVAQAAMETSLEFYNPTSIGADRIGGTTMMGSNAIIRRAALNSIGGYQPGLAEDLATSINLHAAGWRSAYVAEPLAPGQAPPSFTAWFVQQLKWARGVFELLLTAYPRLFQRLTWGQRLSYAVRMTKYWIGPAVGLHLFATIAILIFADFDTRAAFHQYLVQITPLVLIDVLIRFTALYKWRHPSTPRTSLIRAVALIYASWPIYWMAWMMAVLRLPLSFHPTPKTTTGRLNPAWLLPQFFAIVLLTCGMLYTVVIRGHRPSVLLVFAIFQGLLQLVFLNQWLYSDFKFIKNFQKSLFGASQVGSVGRISHKEMRAYLQKYAAGLQITLDQMSMDLNEQLVQLLYMAYLNGRQIFILGSGSSFLTASRFTRDLMKQSRREGPPGFKVTQLGDDLVGIPVSGALGSLTADHLADLVKPGDVLIGIANTHPGPGLMQAIKIARQAEATSVAFSGLQSGPLGRLVDLNLYVPSEQTQQVEEVHLVLGRLICEKLGELAAAEQPPFLPASFPDHNEPGYSLSEPREVELQQHQAGYQARLDAVGLVYSLGQEPDRPSNHNDLLDKMIALILEGLGATSGSLILLDERGKATHGVLIYAGKVENLIMDQLSDTLKHGLAGWVLRQGRPTLVSNTQLDPRWLSRPWDESGSARSAVSVPLITSGRVAGVLTFSQLQPSYFAEHDLLLLEALAVSVSLLLDHRSTNWPTSVRTGF